MLHEQANKQASRRAREQQQQNKRMGTYSNRPHIRIRTHSPTHPHTRTHKHQATQQLPSLIQRNNTPAVAHTHTHPAGGKFLFCVFQWSGTGSQPPVPHSSHAPLTPPHHSQSRGPVREEGKRRPREARAGSTQTRSKALECRFPLSSLLPNHGHHGGVHLIRRQRSVNLPPTQQQRPPSSVSARVLPLLEARP